ncbi:hypothetical protein [Microlunatus speluncae]|uniref:hypothetical protein n=1 Tax=Microlunatus speluncae TaxID=2594267 RepID=UPI0012663711|nr:hypothetical protein [Microlunatus speluncae]
MQDHDLYGVQLRTKELTRLVLLSLALVQVGITIAAMIAPITHTADDDQDPLSTPGLFLALSRIREPGESTGDQVYAMIISAVLVLALLATAVIALLLAGSPELPGRLPTIQYVLAGVLILGAIALLPSVNDLRIEGLGGDRYDFDPDHSAGKAAWGLWLPVAAAVWAINLARGVRRLSE